MIAILYLFKMAISGNCECFFLVSSNTTNNIADERTRTTKSGVRGGTGARHLGCDSGGRHQIPDVLFPIFHNQQDDGRKVLSFFCWGRQLCLLSECFCFCWSNASHWWTLNSLRTVLQVFTEDSGADSMKIGELFMLETVASLDSAMVVAVLQFWASEKVNHLIMKP